MDLITLLRGKFGRNVGSTLITQALSWGMSIYVALFLPGYLGTQNLGMLTLTTAFSGFFGVFVNFGTSTVLVREIAKTPARTKELIRTALVLRSLLGIVALAVGTLGTFLLGYGENIRLLILLSLLITIVGQTAETLQSALKGLEEFPRANMVALTEKVVLSALTIGLVLLKAPLWMFIAVYLIATLVSTILAWKVLSAVIPSSSVPSSGTIKDFAYSGLPFLAAMLFVSIYGDGSSAILMSKLSTLEAIGWFGVAKRLAGAAQMVPVAIAGAMFPMLTRLHHAGDRTEFARTVRRLMGILFVSALPLSLLLIVFPVQLIRLLHYPSGFDGSIPVLRLTGCVLALWFLQQGMGTALIAAGKQAIFGKVTGVAALLALPICSVGIWSTQRFLHNGAIGAMGADAALEAFMLICYTRALLPELNTTTPTQHEAQPVLREFSEAV